MASNHLSVFLLCLQCSCIENALYNKSDAEDSAQTALDEPEASPTQEPTSQPTQEPENSEPGSQQQEPDMQPSGEPTTEPAYEPSTEPSTEPGSAPDNPVIVQTGDLVITEIMINPQQTEDKFGEWIELKNISGDYIDASGLVISDNNLDNYEVQSTQGALVIPPEGYLVICAEEDFWDNGGVDCQATFLYKTLGGGFALSNNDDEIIVSKANGTFLDDFSYGAGFAPEGASMGVENGQENITSNNNPNNWCEQWDFMSGGDSGSPGEENFCW